MARPTKLNAELQQKITDLVRRGNYIETACSSVGIAKRTYYNWKNRGKDEIERVESNSRYRIRKKEKPYVEFYRAIKKAEAEAEILFLEKIRTGEKKWQSAAWYLERKHRPHWGKKQEVTVQGGMEHKHEHSGTINIKQSRADLIRDIKGRLRPSSGQDESE